MDFNQQYQRKDFLIFLESQFLTDGFKILSEDLFSEGNFNFIKKVVLLGEDKNLGVKIFEAEHNSEYDPRVSLSKEAFRLMSNYGAGKALVVFISPKSQNYRFSLITIDLKPKGNRIIQEFSNPRRYSFFLGPDSKTHTPNKFLIKDGKVKDFDDLLSRFAVEVVTKEFFKEYVILFRKIKDNLLDQKISNEKECHDYTLQLLNRIMFLYFVQKKKWLGDNDKFLQSFWNEYKKSKTKNVFFNNWIKVLFFEAFNNKFSAKKYFSSELNSSLQLAPYLNGGLFIENKLDEISFKISDEVFENIFGFFEQYNFTIQESSSVDIDLEIDPKLIGDVYESLVNVSDEDNEKQEKGIFYTDRTEIKFMSGITLSEYFSRYVGNKKLWLDYFFSEDEDKREIIEKLDAKKQWQEIKKAVEELSIVDPACGSGSFLVLMLELVSDVYKLSLEKLKIKKSDYEIKKFIVANCLYGVDVKKWAVHIAELRLWLQLVVYAELDLGQRTLSPLLPNLTFKIRQGDSLTQELAGVDLSSRNKSNFCFDSSLKRKITELKKEKIKFTNNEKPRKYLTASMVENEEKRIYKLILDSKIKILQSGIIKIKNEKYTPPQSLGLAGYETDDIEQEGLFEKQNEQKVIQLENEIEKIRGVKNALNERKPFVWDIDFVEIFSDENEKGFDIVIGNPPYVRQEKIADPFLETDEISTENKKEYKEKLARSVKTLFPFIEKINKKSDLYIYFYFHGLSLLNSEGIFCFITSNSWLDVGYGKDLQKFLLENAKIKAIYDNSAKRSFASADVNTVISLFSAPNIKDRKSNLGNIAKFVMFKKPFEEIMKADILIDLESSISKRITSNDNFRVFAKEQADLLEEGIEYENEEQKKLSCGKYVGDKWGGKYLRAPDIFFTILEKGKDKLVKLGDIAEVRFGIKTGVNEFFYLTDEQIDKWKIEKEFLKQVIKSPRECKSILVNPKDLKYKIFMCNKNKKDLKSTNALKYIEWGEKQDFNKSPTVRNRKYWWQNPDFSSKIFMQMSYNDIFKFWYSKNKIRCDARLYTISLKSEEDVYLLNSTISAFIIELFGRANLGEGALDFKVYEADQILVLDKEKIKTKISREIFLRPIKSIFEECGIDPKSKTPIEEQEPKPMPDRAELDKIVFDALGLTESERKEVYRAVCQLVWNRISKAKSV